MGAGISGHTAALYLRRLLSKEHEVHVVSPKTKWNWIPSNIWVGVGEMTEKQVTFELPPIYKKQGIVFTQGNGIEIYPEGDANHLSPYIKIQPTEKLDSHQESILEYDYLVNATDPKLNFEATPGLGPNHHSLSVCTADHAI
jgi:sulfide:quinone oxidoreductase